MCMVSFFSKRFSDLKIFLGFSFEQMIDIFKAAGLQNPQAEVILQLLPLILNKICFFSLGYVYNVER